jgi:transposase
MLPRAHEAYQAGASVDFGPFSVSRAGITKGKATLPWEQVEQVELRQGVLHIRKKGERRDWAFAMASKIPNLPVLMALANQRYLR